MAGTDDHAAEQLALGAIGENVDEVQRELFDAVMNHHKIAVNALQLFFVGLDLHLAGLRLRRFLVHADLLKSASKVPQPDSRLRNHGAKNC